MSKHKLLLADDSITIQKVVNLTFADEGVEVVSVGDGNSALDKLRDEPPDIVLADVNMPGLTGYEICARIKERDPKDQIPVVLLVGSFEPFDEEEAERVGADGYLTKPFQSISQLVDKVAELLGTKKDETGDATSASAAGAVYCESGIGGFTQSVDSNQESGESPLVPVYPDMEEPSIPDPYGAFEADDDDFEMSEAFGGDDAEIIEETDHDSDIMEASEGDSQIEEIHEDFNKTQPLTESDIREMAVGNEDSKEIKVEGEWQHPVELSDEEPEPEREDPSDDIRYLSEEMSTDESFAEDWKIEDSSDDVDFEVTSDEIEDEIASFSEPVDEVDFEVSSDEIDDEIASFSEPSDETDESFETGFQMVSEPIEQREPDEFAFTKGGDEGPLEQDFGGEPEQEFGGEDENDFGGEPEQEFCGERDQEFGGEREQEFSGEGGQEFSGEGGQEFSGEGGQEFSGEGGQEFSGEGGQEFSGEGGQEFGGERDQEFGGEPEHEFGGERDQEFGSEDEQEFGGERDQEFGSEDEQKFGGEREQEFGGEEESVTEFDTREEVEADDESGLGIFEDGDSDFSREFADTPVDYDDSTPAFDSFSDTNDDDDVREDTVESFVAAEFPMPEGASVLNLDEVNLLELPPVETVSEVESTETASTNAGMEDSVEEAMIPESTIEMQTACAPEIEEARADGGSEIQGLFEPGGRISETRASVDQALSKEMVEAITQRVIETLSERAIREIAWEVVPDMANLIIKKMAEDKMKD